jgi:3-phosphoglycerate kinase
MFVKPTFQSWHCKGQRIFLRTDLNIPLANGVIIGDQRLQTIQPTLDYLLKKETQVILATHIGRPEKRDPALSTKHLVPWFQKKGYAIKYIETIQEIHEATIEPHTIILLENLRFFPGEKKNDIQFAQELAALAPWYVNDAFGTLHRTDSSITLLADQYAPDHRSIGFLIEKELAVLNDLKNNPVHPVCFILGGGKVADKIPFIEHLYGFADIIVLCPALVFTFLKSFGKPIGKSLIDQTALTTIPALLAKKNKKTTIVFPQDYQIAHNDINGPLSYTDINSFPRNGVGISIGPKSIAFITELINTAGTIFYNGMMGFENRKETLEGITAILTAMSDSSATTYVAGGDSIALVDQLKLKGITHCITGGGATLAYLSNQALPGLQPFLKDGTKPNKTQSF